MFSDLQLKAFELNRTLSRKDGTPDKSLKQMKEEIQAMLVEMRARKLEGKKTIADEEMEYEKHIPKPTGHARLSHTRHLANRPAFVSYISRTQMFSLIETLCFELFFVRTSPIYSTLRARKSF